MNDLTLKEDQLQEISIFTQKGLALKTEAEALVVEQAGGLQLAEALRKRGQSLRKEIDLTRKNLIFPFQDFVKQVNALATECEQPGVQAEMIISQKLLAFNEQQEAIRREEAEKERQRLEAIRLKEEADKKARDAEEARLRKIEEGRLAKIAAEQEEARKAIAAEQDANKRAQAEIEAKRLEAEAKLEAERVRIEQQKRAMEEQQKEIDAQKAAMAEKERAKQQAEQQAIADSMNKVKGLRSPWTYEIENEALVPRELCSPDSKKINAAIKAGVRVANGLRIYQDKKIQ